jgi:hypothetical protein
VRINEGKNCKAGQGGELLKAQTEASIFASLTAAAKESQAEAGVGGVAAMERCRRWRGLGPNTKYHGAEILMIECGSLIGLHAYPCGFCTIGEEMGEGGRGGGGGGTAAEGGGEGAASRDEKI